MVYPPCQNAEDRDREFSIHYITSYLMRQEVTITRCAERRGQRGSKWREGERKRHADRFRL